MNEPTEHGGGPDRAMDAVVAASRVYRGSVMDDGKSEPLGNALVGRIIGDTRRFLEDQEKRPRGERITQAKLARAIGEKPSTVSQVLAYKYPPSKTGDQPYRRRDAILRKLDQQLARLEKAKDAPERSGHAWTKPALEIRGVADAAVQLGTMAAVTCDSGGGKTMTAETLPSVFAGAILITVNDACHSPITFLRRLCEALKLRLAGQRQSLMDLATTRLKETRQLIIIDEADLADARLLNTIRQVHDATGCPVLLLGMPALLKNLQQARADDSRGAMLFSRIGIKRDLTERCRQDGDRGEPLYSVEDVRKVFARSKLRIAADAVRWLHALANLPDCGRLRSCNSAVRLGAHIAQQTGETEITLTLLLQAEGCLLGIEGARQLANRIKQQVA